ncbi:MAG: cysteine desulfurase family protein [Planctomycetota bacterium]|nr:cysteine desulfurase family protein [Planctomycetota bacterium]
MKRIYLDHNSTTPMRPEARELLLELTAELAGNPSSLHAGGRRARDEIDRARACVAAVLGVAEDEVLFTSGGTESNNLALLGHVHACGPEAGLVTTAAEHSSVLAAADALEAEGRPVARVGVDAAGLPDLDELLAAAARPGTALVSVMAANNEVGSTPPLDRLGARLADLPPDRRPVFHADAVQALGRVPLDLAGWGVDLASFSAHKVGGPVGVGVLVRRGRTPLAPLLHGGEQEHGLRPGTENAAGIAAAARAIELAVAELADYRSRVCRLTTALWAELASRLPSARLLGPPIDTHERLPNTLCVSLPNTDGKVLVTRLDLDGLELSAGSACASGSIEPSHVLLAMGADEAVARSGLRISLGRTTTEEDCHRAVDILVKAFSSSRAT